jgi:hypothetical protein
VSNNVPWDFDEAREACRKAAHAQEHAEEEVRRSAQELALAEERYRVALAKRIVELAGGGDGCDGVRRPRPRRRERCELAPDAGHPGGRVRGDEAGVVAAQPEPEGRAEVRGLVAAAGDRRSWDGRVMGWSWTQKDQDDLQRDTDRYERPDVEDDVWVAEPSEDRASARESE